MVNELFGKVKLNGIYRNLALFLLIFSVVEGVYSEGKASISLCHSLFFSTAEEANTGKIEKASITKAWINPSHAKGGVVILLKNSEGRSIILIGAKDRFSTSSEELQNAIGLFFSSNDVKQLEPERERSRLLVNSLEHAMDNELRELYYSNDGLAKVSLRIFQLQKNNKIEIQFEK